MKIKSLLLGLALMLPVLAFADSGYYYVTGNNVNLRAKPNTSGKKLGTLTKYSVIEVYNIVGDWAECEYDFETGYVNKSFLQPLQSDPIEKSEIAGKTLSLFTDPSADLDGYIRFEFKPNSNEFTGDYRLWIPSWRKAGGTGTADWGDFEGVWNDDKRIAIYEYDLPTVYDKKAGLLYCMDYLWKVK